MVQVGYHMSVATVVNVCTLAPGRLRQGDSRSKTLSQKRTNQRAKWNYKIITQTLKNLVSLAYNCLFVHTIFFTLN